MLKPDKFPVWMGKGGYQVPTITEEILVFGG